jgi:tripartite-type tricarboxylate transporter receptor subunit TctC
MIAALGSAGSASAADYPSRPLRLVVPFAPGGTNDVIGRIVAERIGDRLGHVVVVDNRAGANSILGSEIVARAGPDGHTMLIVAAPSTRACSASCPTTRCAISRLSVWLQAAPIFSSCIHP